MFVVPKSIWPNMFHVFSYMGFSNILLFKSALRNVKLHMYSHPFLLCRERYTHPAGTYIQEASCWTGSLLKSSAIVNDPQFYSGSYCVHMIYINGLRYVGALRDTFTYHVICSRLHRLCPNQVYIIRVISLILPYGSTKM